MAPYNNTISSPELCAARALFLNSVDESTAFNIWINLFCIPVPYMIFVSWWTAIKTRSASENDSRPFFGKTEKWFCASTVSLGCQCVLFLVMVLAIQAQMYCAGGPISNASYVGQWIFQGVVGGGILASAFLSWYNSLLAVREKEDVLCHWWVFKWEAYLLVSPFILIAMGFVVLVKGPAACGELKWVKSFQEWRSARSDPIAGLRNWMKRPGERSWWGGKKRQVSIDLERPAAPNNFDKHHWPRSPLGWRDRIRGSTQSYPVASPPPPYAWDDPQE